VASPGKVEALLPGGSSLSADMEIKAPPMVSTTTSRTLAIWWRQSAEHIRPWPMPSPWTAESCLGGCIGRQVDMEMEASCLLQRTLQNLRRARRWWSGLWQSRDRKVRTQGTDLSIQKVLWTTAKSIAIVTSDELGDMAVRPLTILRQKSVEHTRPWRKYKKFYEMLQNRQQSSEKQ
jgi:hypothetical protein